MSGLLAVLAVFLFSCDSALRSGLEYRRAIQRYTKAQNEANEARVNVFREMWKRMP